MKGTLATCGHEQVQLVRLYSGKQPVTINEVALLNHIHPSKRMKMYSALLVLCFSLYSSTASTDTYPSPPPSQSLIKVLANISNQLGSVKSVGDSLNSVTNLLHVSLLKELLDTGKREGVNNEGLAILRRMEVILNESCHANELKELQS